MKIKNGKNAEYSPESNLATIRKPLLQAHLMVAWFYISML